MVLVGSGSGIMFSIAAWGMIEPSIDGLDKANVKGIIPVTICFFAGVIFQVILDKIIPHTHVYSEITEGPRSRLDPEIKVMLTEVIHHIPEGIALGAIYAAHFMKTEWISSSVAIVLAIAIAFQNIPEAIYVSLPIGEKGSNAGKAFRCADTSFGSDHDCVCCAVSRYASVYHGSGRRSFDLYYNRGDPAYCIRERQR